MVKSGRGKLKFVPSAVTTVTTRPAGLLPTIAAVVTSHDGKDGPIPVFKRKQEETTGSKMGGKGKKASKPSGGEEGSIPCASDGEARQCSNPQGAKVPVVVDELAMATEA